MPAKKKRKRRKTRVARRSGVKSQNPVVSVHLKSLTSNVSEAANPGYAREIRMLVSKGEFKTAINLAKQYHKNLATEESEAVLVEAYVARILEMMGRGLVVEAGALLDLVTERYGLPDHHHALITVAAAARDGINDSFLAPLNDPSIAAEHESFIHEIIERELVDLSILTGARTLSADHPLKLQAAIVSDAFREVTSGPVDSDETALPGIPRRSPLGPWKMLIQALYCFYGRDDALCERYLRSIRAGSVPARLVPAIRAMIAGKGADHLDKKARFLVEQVGGSREELRKRFHDLERALISGKSRELLGAIRRAVVLCEECFPEFVDRLKQHISVRCYMIDADDDSLVKAMGGPSLKNAYFWRLLASAAEIKGEWFLACALWNEFMKHALHEGMFSENSPEQAELYLHMADLISEIWKSDMARERWDFEASFRRSNGLSSYYRGQPGLITDVVRKDSKNARNAAFLYPERMYRLACKIEPTSEAFDKWLKWIDKSGQKRKVATEVALAWHEAIPGDVKPVVYLARAAQKRNALNKCLRYLDEAERIDPLNPDIKDIRVKVFVATAVRHLKKKKIHLAKKDFRKMDAMPLFQAGDRPALLTALKAVCAMIEGDDKQLAGFKNDLVKLMNSHVSAELILGELMKACGLPGRSLHLALKSEKGLKPGDLLSAVGRACLLGDDAGVPIPIPVQYSGEMEEALAGDVPPPASSMMRAVAEAALRSGRMELAYAASGAGLRGEDAESARFLLLRARSLPHWESSRKNDCIGAAVALARRERDMALIDEAIELSRTQDGLLYISPLKEDVFSADPEKIRDVLTRERQDREYPRFSPGLDLYNFDDEEYDRHDLDQCLHCDVEGCPDRLAPYMPHDDDEWDEDHDLDESEIELLKVLHEEGLIDLPPGIPPEAVTVLLEAASKYGMGETSDLEKLVEKDPHLVEELLKIMGDAQAGPGRRSKKKQRKKGKRR